MFRTWSAGGPIGGRVLGYGLHGDGARSEFLACAARPSRAERHVDLIVGALVGPVGEGSGGLHAIGAIAFADSELDISLGRVDSIAGGAGNSGF